VKSIRFFLLSRLLGGATLVLAAAGAAVYVAVARSLQAGLDRDLAARVESLASVVFQTREQVDFEFSDQLMPEYGGEEGGPATPRPAYFEIEFADGTLLERSNSLAGADLITPDEVTATPSYWTAPLPDGRDGRYVAQRIEVHHVFPEEGPDRPTAARLVLVVAQGREELVALERMLLAQCVGACILLAGLIAALSWLAVERGLEPARRLAARLDAIRVDDLPAQLEAGELPAELAPVADKIDALIGRVQTALSRERRTTADIAHELRTPVSELLTVSEVALRDGNDARAGRIALAKVRDVAWRMGRSLSTLLKLARLEMGAERIDRESVDLGGIVREFLRSLSAAARERGIKVESDVGLGDRVAGDPEVLRIVVSNLLSNAIHYSARDGVVRCSFESPNGSWRLVIENEAGDLEPEDLRSLSEPFWRKDRARTDSDRSGLGLALSRALAEKTGMELAFELENRVFRAVLSSDADDGAF